VSYKNQELFTLRERLCSPLFFSGVRCVQSLVLYLVSFVLFVFVLCIVPIVASVYGLSILDCNLYYYKCYDMIYATISSWFPSEFTPLVRWSSPLFLLVTILYHVFSRELTKTNFIVFGLIRQGSNTLTAMQPKRFLCYLLRA
jgi:hypothetical protein